MNTSNQHNIKVFALNDGSNPGFNIILDFSGHRELLLYHKRNGLLYRLLKDGVRVEELRRFKQKGSHSRHYRGNRRSSNTKLDSMVSYLLTVIETYLKERMIFNEKKQETSNSEYKHKRNSMKSKLSETKTDLNLEKGVA